MRSIKTVLCAAVIILLSSSAVFAGTESLPEDVKTAYANIIIQLEEEYGPAYIVTWEDKDGDSYPHCSGRRDKPVPGSGI